MSSSSSSDILSTDELNKLTRQQKASGLEANPEQSVQDSQELWKRLVETAKHPAASERHVTAACNAICFVVRSYTHSSDEAVRRLAYLSDTWMQAFRAARCAFASGKNKPALQVLDTLVYLAQSNPSKQLVTQNVTRVVHEMLSVVYTQQPKGSLKEACIVLYFFLRKLSDFMTVPDLFEHAFESCRSTFARLCYVSHISLIDGPRDQWLAFALSLLMIVQNVECRSAALKLLSLLCMLPASMTGVDMVATLHDAIEIYSKSDESALEDVIRDILPSVLTSFDQYHVFLSKQTQGAGASIAATQVVLALLDFGKRKNFITEAELPQLVNNTFFGQDDAHLTEQQYHGFRQLLTNNSPAVRFKCFELLTSATSTRKHLSIDALDCLSASLRHLHDDVDAFHRGTSRSALASGEQQELLQAIDNFYKNYLTFLKYELAPHLSYGRHILALDILLFLAETFGFHHESVPLAIVADVQLISSLFSLVLDPFEDVRSTTAMILLQAVQACRAPSNIGSPVLNSLYDTMRTIQPVSEASKLAAATNRADHADALGRLISFAQMLDDTAPEEAVLVISAGGFGKLVENVHGYIKSVPYFDVSARYPLHGNILGISYSIKHARHNNDTSLSQILINICDRVWSLSQPHLCVDSPEMETEALDEAQNSGPKDQLAYAWRALRDSNVLMQAMLNSISPTISLLQVVGDLCFDQLARLRHRGAFSAVAQTFTLCCQRTRGLVTSETQPLIRVWFERALSELERQADKLTRRSAGLPALFTAILDPHDQQRFSSFFLVLVEIAVQQPPESDSTTAQNQMRLPQVHALNCIKDIITTSRFRVMTQSFVVSMINLAAQSMCSSIWAIKNCGLMLLRASINRLDPETGLGTAEAGLKPRGTSAGDRRPFEIATLILHDNADTDGTCSSALSTGKEADSTEAQFAGLDLLSRLYLREDERTIAKRIVIRKLGHRLWHIRAQAARLVAQIVLPGEELSLVEMLLCRTGSDGELCVNGMHGRLLAANNILQNLKRNNDASQYLVKFVHMFTKSISLPRQSCHTLVAVQLAIAMQLLELCGGDLTSAKSLRASLDHLAGASLPSTTSTTAALYNRAIGSLWSGSHTTAETGVATQLLRALQTDQDIAAYVFEQDSLPLPNLEITIGILGMETADDIQCAAINSILQQFRTRSDPLVFDEAKKLTAQIDFRSSISRPLMIGHLKLFAFLCTQAWQSSMTKIIPQLRALAPGFVIHLRAASNDEHEDTMRRGAVEALQQWEVLGGVSVMLEDFCGRMCKFEIMSVLYDMLNDDDEDIRQTATEVAVMFSNPYSEPNRAINVLCATASRDRLREHILQDFAEDEILRLECFRRVLGTTATGAPRRLQHALVSHCKRRTFVQEKERVLAAANTLFAEEKQNLYIDQYAEIKVWAQIASETRPVSERQTSAIEHIAHWTKSGLATIGDASSASAVQDVYGTSSGLGLIDCSIEDLNVMIVRVVTVARLLGGFEGDLAPLQEACSQDSQLARIHTAFTWSLQ